MAPKIIVVGGGLAGCGAALAAAKAGGQVTLFEKSDVLGGCAQLAGQWDHRRFTVREELRLMGCDEIFQLFEKNMIHECIQYSFEGTPGSMQMFYDPYTSLDVEMLDCLCEAGVDVRLQTRVKNVVMDGSRIRGVSVDGGKRFDGDAFVDATGGAGGMANCRKYGNGCAMCMLRCPAFGDRVSLAEKAGVSELQGRKSDGSVGPLSSADAYFKDTLAPDLKRRLEQEGQVVVPLPPHLVNYERSKRITASGNIHKGFIENIVLVNIGPFAKRVAGAYTPLPELRQVPGFEKARHADPVAGIGNAVRYMAISPRDNALRVPQVDNLFVAGEKLNVVGVGEAPSTGIVAGHNAVRKAAGKEPLILPGSTMLGDFIGYLADQWGTGTLHKRVHLWVGPYWDRAEKIGVYSDDPVLIRHRVEEAGLSGVLARRVA